MTLFRRPFPTLVGGAASMSAAGFVVLAGCASPIPGPATELLADGRVGSGSELGGEVARSWSPEAREQVRSRLAVMVGRWEPTISGRVVSRLEWIAAGLRLRLTTSPPNPARLACLQGAVVSFLTLVQELRRPSRRVASRAHLVVDRMGSRLLACDLAPYQNGYVRDGLTPKVRVARERLAQAWVYRLFEDPRADQTSREAVELAELAGVAELEVEARVNRGWFGLTQTSDFAGAREAAKLALARALESGYELGQSRAQALLAETWLASLDRNPPPQFAGYGVGPAAEAPALLAAEAAVALEARLFGVGHPITLRGRVRLGYAARRKWQLTRTLSWLGGALRSLESALGSQHPDTLVALGRLADTYADHGQPYPALASAEEAFRRSRRALGAFHPATMRERLRVQKLLRQAPPGAPRDGRIELRADLPKSLRCDGNLAEWGQIPAPSEGLAGIVLALTAKRVALGGRLKGRASQGVWLELRFPNSGFPWAARWVDNGGGVSRLRCGGPPPGSSHWSDDDEAKCQLLARRWVEQARQYRADFRRLYRLDSQGIRLHTEGRGLSPVLGAEYAFLRGARESSFEVSLPTLALPRSEAAPVREIELRVTGAPESAPPAEDEEGGTLYRLPRPVGFAPYAAWRAQVFRATSARSPQPAYESRYSYQPGTDRVEESQGMVLATLTQELGSLPATGRVEPGPFTSRRLFTPLTALGKATLGVSDFGLGLCEAHQERCDFDGEGTLLVEVPGAFPRPLVTLRPAVEWGYRLRAGKLHLLTLDTQKTGTELGALRGEAGVQAWTLDGTGKVEALPLEGIANVGWRDRPPARFHDTDWTRFGLRGSALWKDDTLTEAEVSWTWEPNLQRYLYRGPVQ